MINYEIRSIQRDDYSEWLLKKHYAHRIPSVTYAFGLFSNKIMIGVCTFGTSLCSQLQLAVGEYKVLELNRLVVEDNLEKNSLSFFVSSSLKLLPKPV